jgi:hypothetical protein
MASLEDQVRSVEPPDATAVGAALNETVGAGDPGGGGVLFAPPYAAGPPPPQAARPRAHNSTNEELRRVGMPGSREINGP